ncbi:hypothetical protein [Synechococcus sp. HK01-R]|uniref:hypothetical protein n=1 Tax=Synechococcus sp. HK01-R TaxID=2751171 RepID=UPI00210799AA|nr:hypothetical protein [Synechococcus sp. HK01-R]
MPQLLSAKRPVALGRQGFLVAGLMALVTVAGIPRGARAANPAPLRIDLECNRNGGGWQTCQMRVVRIGEEWWLDLPDRQLHFRHDGSGRMRLRDSSKAGWQPVEARWVAERTLCWDGICARGNLPLD